MWRSPLRPQSLYQEKGTRVTMYPYDTANHLLAFHFLTHAITFASRASQNSCVTATRYTLSATTPSTGRPAAIGGPCGRRRPPPARCSPSASGRRTA